MPTYCFTDKKGLTREIVMSMSAFSALPARDLPDGSRQLKVAGRWFTQNIAAQRRGSQTFPQNWPMESHVLGVSKKQIASATRKAKAAGIDIEFNPDNGHAILRTPEIRKKYAEFRGLMDLNCYGTSGDAKRPNDVKPRALPPDKMEVAIPDRAAYTRAIQAVRQGMIARGYNPDGTGKPHPELRYDKSGKLFITRKTMDRWKCSMSERPVERVS